MTCHKLLYLLSKKNISKSQAQQLSNAQCKYSQQAASFTESMSGFFPLVVPLLEEETRTNAEKSELAPVILLSYFDETKRVACNMQLPAQIEHNLWESQANDLLEEV
ncbi:hypothetical protein Moror_9556 [Moniliophthora roreri MCA 2997]|uniref:Uncharacterized protein n=1 Tax=Moniliophthora roreri (strain MCA 2997) TaxID=1381753 RepID=V2WWB8_MONRO|nr:hypothetical protein Moror_9556 [Moniliophthora roreri MCA 2997]